ncbi:MAG: dihydroorotate dehydrogenase-like protein [Proteobacteria bacterium]|jgi:dihydroorotate dehydrogenase (fumarate)|nr:dihydroorotate dehydrogenase-like protein [Pseudomonadota bacterium]MCG6936179.1 dihydroorotate dehydrogenase-like protein [Pseudomonadota bacterium]
MIDMTTEYLGLKLANPLVPSASPLSKNVDTALRLEDAGASALVMYSLFEEKIDYEERHLARFLHEQDIGNPEAGSFHPVPADYHSYQDEYLDQLRRLKSQLDIPVIASLNGTSLSGWINYGKELQEAGADALELNVYYVAARYGEISSEVEDRYIDLLTELRRHVTIPITMKLSSQFSSFTDIAQRLESAGAGGLVLFNRFYQPDIDLETLQVVPRLNLSSSFESLLRIRWVAILYDHVKLSLAVTGGFHTSQDILKALLAGADVTHLCSALLTHGPGHITTLLRELEIWLEEHEYESVQQLKGSISQGHAIDPAAYERANYVEVLDSFTPPPGVLR